MGKKSQQSSYQNQAVELTEVSKSFGSQGVLRDISFQVYSGQGICICGANAAGKTTLLRVISGLLQANEGSVRIYGFDVRMQPEKVKPLLGVIFHENMVYPQLTVVENLKFFSRLYGLRNNEAHIQKLLEQIGLMPYRYDMAGVLSRGMTQRLAIVRALVHKPTVLLADEPFTGLDNDASNILVTMLSDFKSDGGAMVMTTHNIDFALQCCEQVAVLDNRKLFFTAKASEIDTAEFRKDYLLYARGQLR